MPFGRYTCRVQWHIVFDGIPDPHKKARFGVEPRANNAIANCNQTASPMLRPHYFDSAHAIEFCQKDAAIHIMEKLRYCWNISCKTITMYASRMHQFYQHHVLASQHECRWDEFICIHFFSQLWAYAQRYGRFGWMNAFISHTCGYEDSRIAE